MIGVSEVWVGAAVVVASATLAALNHHPDNGHRFARDRAAVRAAADQLTCQAISHAWTHVKLANTTELDNIRSTIPLRHVGVHHQVSPSTIVTFAGHHATCIDLSAARAVNTVRVRAGC